MEAVALRKPWENWTTTCGRCGGPFSTLCLGQKRCPTTKVVIASCGNWLYDCAICERHVSFRGPLPSHFEVETWQKIQAQHSRDCEWAKTRGYQLTA